MMNCDEWKPFAHDYVFGDLSDPARGLLDRHVAACASCLAEARALKLVDRRLARLPVVDPPAALWKRALEEVSVMREMWRVAAAVLLAAGLGALAGRLPEAPKVMTQAAQMIPTFLLPE